MSVRSASAGRGGAYRRRCDPPENSAVANRVAPSTSGGPAAELLAELEPDREHRVGEVADVHGRQLAALDRVAQVGLELPQAGGQHGIAEALADRAEIAPQEGERAGVGGDELEERAEAVLEEVLSSGRRATGVADAPAGVGARLLHDRAEHRRLVREVVVERARGQLRAARTMSRTPIAS